MRRGAGLGETPRNPETIETPPATAVGPITSTETQLDFGGGYEPPMGPLGGALDAMIGHRIADASIHRFLADVAHHLRTTMGTD